VVRPEDEMKRQLDAVVGDSYRPPRNWRNTLLRWLAAAVLAVGASAVIVTILDTYIAKAQKEPPPPRPVQVQILPSK
jgi:hypothetical protein